MTCSEVVTIYCQHFRVLFVEGLALHPESVVSPPAAGLNGALGREGHYRSSTVDNHKMDSAGTVRCLETSEGLPFAAAAVGCVVAALQVHTVVPEDLSDSLTVAEPFAVVAEGAVAVVVVAAAAAVDKVVAAAVAVVDAAVAAATSSAAVAVGTAVGLAAAVAVAAVDIVVGETVLLSSVADKGMAAPAVLGGTLLKPGQHPSNPDYWRHLWSSVALNCYGLDDEVHNAPVLLLVAVECFFCFVWDLPCDSGHVHFEHPGSLSELVCTAYGFAAGLLYGLSVLRPGE